MVAEPVYCGVDIGTTNLKVVLVDDAGRTVAVARARTPVTADEHGPCHDPDVICGAVEDLLATAHRTAPCATEIRAIGVTSVGEEGVPLDERGAVLYPAIAWYDRRASPAGDAWRAEHSDAEMQEVTGLHHDLGFTLYKWLWLRSYQPEVWRRCARWLGIGDYLIWRWTGQAGMSRSHASRTLCFNLSTLDWVQDWAERALSHGADTFPRLVDAGEIIGHVRPGALPGIALHDGAPVVATGLDHSVGGYAAGIRNDGEVIDSLGTAEALVAPLGVAPDPAVWRTSRIDFGAGLDPGSILGLGGLNSGADLARLRQDAGASAPLSATQLEKAAAEVEVGSGGLTYVPSRIRDSGVGAFLGEATDPVSDAQRYRAALEGWSMATAEIIDELPHLDQSGADIACTGGGAESRLWLRIKASVLNRPIRVVRTAELVGVGAALLAARAVGQTVLSQTWVPDEQETIVPVPEWVDAYRAQRERFRQAAQRVYHEERAPFYP